MPSYLKGIEKLCRGILEYRNIWKDQMVQEFKQVRDNPRPSAVFMTCVDSRLLPTRFTQTHVGDMFISRNVGNVIPHSRNFDPTNPSPEPGVLELGCAVNKIAHVIVCGHSDCKAMNLLHSMREEVAGMNLRDLGHTPIKAWLLKHALTSLEKFEELEKVDFRKPLMVRAESALNSFPAYIDVDNAFSHTDKLSQVNTLMQMENIASYPFMADCIRDGKTHIHAMWFDIFTGEIYFFSRKQKHFLPILDDNVDTLLEELNEGSGGAPLDAQDAKNLVKAAQDLYDPGQGEDSAKKCC